MHMISEPLPSFCPRCNAPLQLDEAGRCDWCRAHLQTVSPQGHVLNVPAGSVKLLPADVDDMGVAPFIKLTLAVLGLLRFERAVQEFAGREPELVRNIVALSGAVADAGARVRNAGLLKSGFDNNLRVYTPAEIWICNLAIDLIAFLGSLDGLRNGTRAQIANNLRTLDQNTSSHTWKKDVKGAGAGPAQFRELRAAVPYHTPRPGR
jgi:hypothetical protein